MRRTKRKHLYDSVDDDDDDDEYDHDDDNDYDDEGRKGGEWKSDGYHH